MLKPDTEHELSELIRATTGPLAIRGGKTRIAEIEGEDVFTTGLAGISLYEPGALTIVAGAGTPLAEIEAALATEGQMLPFEVTDMRGLMGLEGVSTIGGVFATNASGPRRVQAGAARDSLIGVRFVDGLGNISKNGGRVMKNVTGYDLVKLMAGSHGTLGVLTEVSIKVLPAPAVCAVLLIKDLSPQRAVEAMTSAMASPYEVSGAAHATVGPDGGPVTMIRIEGFQGSVDHRVTRLCDHLKEFGDVTVETDPVSTIRVWKWVRDVEPFHVVSGNVWRISVKPTDGPLVVDRLDATGIVMDWSGGLIWALTETGQDVRAAMAPIPGHATLVRSEGLDFTRFHPESAPVAAIAKGLREKFDPRGILNPRLMG